MSVDLKKLNSSLCYGGSVDFYSHVSRSTKTDMRFSVFVPPQAKEREVPVLYWLSGLTCTEENFMAKSGGQRWGAEHGIMIVCPDTSPRNTGIPGENKDWDFGTGAGFYLNATKAPWSAHFKMEDYVIKELSDIIDSQFPVLPGKRGVSGHSMGGHGALTLSLRYPDHFKSVSAFSPICAPSACPWGQKAFQNYLGEEVSAWAEYDASQLVKHARKRVPFLVDQGTADKFLKDQLMPERLVEACKLADYPVELHMREGYDHSYYFVASFLEDHFKHHAKELNRLNA